MQLPKAITISRSFPGMGNRGFRGKNTLSQNRHGAKYYHDSIAALWESAGGSSGGRGKPCVKISRLVRAFHARIISESNKTQIKGVKLHWYAACYSVYIIVLAARRAA
jgi:hypothetical protein